MSEGKAAQRRPRADAARNRGRLVEAATRLFAEDGVDTSLEAIARQAGVGIGTLYRHFPTREALVETVYRSKVEALRQASIDLSANCTPDEALEQWMRHFVEYIAAKRGMSESLKRLMESNSPLFAELWGTIPVTLKELMERAALAGTIRSDADSLDVLHALSGLYSTATGPEWRDRSQRLISLLMDGLRFGAPNAASK